MPMTPSALLSDSVSLLRKMISVQSTSFHEQEVCTLISSALGGWGIQHSVIKNNILAYNANFSPSLPTLVLDAHIDTVPPAQSYTRDPYDPGHDTETIFGLGANDDGGSVVSMIAVFRHFYDKKLPINLVLSLSAEEERMGPDGAKYIYSNILSSEPSTLHPAPCTLLNPTWVIIGEPTGMRAATSERGLLVLDGKAVGVSGHAARNEGVNALYIALDDINRIRSYHFDRVSPIMGAIKLNVTQISAGTAHNVIPDSCSFVVDIRPTEQYTNQEIVDMLQKECTSQLTPRNLNNHSSATPSSSLLLSVVDTLAIETFSSPTTSNWISINCDAIKMGPGDSARSHRADEYILTSEISDAIAKYISFIDELAKKSAT